MLSFLITEKKMKRVKRETKKIPKDAALNATNTNMPRWNGHPSSGVQDKPAREGRNLTRRVPSSKSRLTLHDMRLLPRTQYRFCHLLDGLGADFPLAVGSVHCLKTPRLAREIQEGIPGVETADAHPTEWVGVDVHARYMRVPPPRCQLGPWLP